MSVAGLVEQFSELEDPRMVGKIDHRLSDILVIAVCAVIACAESWDDIALYGRSKESWLRRFLDLPGATHEAIKFLIVGSRTYVSDRLFARQTSANQDSDGR